MKLYPSNVYSNDHSTTFFPNWPLFRPIAVQQRGISAATNLSWHAPDLSFIVGEELCHVKQGHVLTAAAAAPVPAPHAVLRHAVGATLRDFFCRRNCVLPGGERNGLFLPLALCTYNVGCVFFSAHPAYCIFR